MNFVLLCVWEDSRVWAHGNDSKDMHPALQAQFPVLHPESPVCTVRGSCGGCWLDGCTILCLLTR